MLAASIIVPSTMATTLLVPQRVGWFTRRPPATLRVANLFNTVLVSLNKAIVNRAKPFLG